MECMVEKKCSTPSVQCMMSTSTTKTIVNETSATHSITEEVEVISSRTKDFGFLPIPTKLRYDPHRPFYFGLLLNVSFGLASTLLVANMYYCQPLLIQLSISFHVTYDEVSRIPTLLQAGYGVGLLLISPLGDLIRRRQLILLLILSSAALSVGLALTSSLPVFEAISFLVGVASVAPQILMPLAADLAPPERRASAISVVLSGFLLGILIARVAAGIVGDFASWRIVYFVSIGVQSVVLFGAYIMLPDYPCQNQDLTYFKIFQSMAKYAVTEPVVVQIILINSAASACYTSFWVTLTFLLGGSPYEYSTLIIGLFGLIGMLGVIIIPFSGR
ncbi:hypothetical protein SERLA73DRAFT_182575, partial [Serpula lacrymans var. lacrymans S7.3]